MKEHPPNQPRVHRRNVAATTRFKLASYSSTGRRPIIRRRSRSGGTIRTCEFSPYEGERDGPLLHPRCKEHKTSLVHVRGFEPPKPQRIAVLRTAAANRICLTCTSWRRERGFEPAAPEGALAFRASALDLTRPSLQTGGSGANRTLTSRRMARFERGGLAKCPALPKHNGGDERIRTSGPESSPGL